MKIKFDWDDNLPLNETIENHKATVVVTAVFHGNKYHLQFFLDECLYKYE